MSELFITATKNKFRFDTIRGYVTTEDLWDMPLVDTNRNDYDFSLNKVAQELSKQLKALGEEDFVATKVTKDKVLEQKLDLVKFIIESKLKDATDREEALEKRTIRDKARKILSERSDFKFTELSDKELKKLAK